MFKHFNASNVRELQKNKIEVRLQELNKQVHEVVMTTSQDFTFFEIESKISEEFQERLKALGFTVREYYNSKNPRINTLTIEWRKLD